MHVRIAAALAFSLVASSAHAATAPVAAASPHTLDATDLSAWLDGYMPYALRSGDIAGSVIVVVKDGHILFEKGYGYSDVAKRTPMDPERTLVRAGSTSKLFTWTAVMQQVEQHKLDLDRDVNAYLDFTIPHKNGKAVTLRDLMNHRGGFEEGLKDLLATDPNNAETTEQYLKQHPRPLLFTPGTVPAYSNYGAALAGYIVQRVSGETFEDYTDRHIFAPLGMQHTTFRQPLPANLRPMMSKGYQTASSPPHPYEYVITGPAGSVATTASDMAQFMIAQLQLGRFGSTEILKPETAALMQQPTETSLPGFDVMAHGFFHDVKNGHLVIGHGGDTIVFHTELDLLPQDGVGIFYNFNSRGKNDAVYGARAQLLEEFLDRYFPAPASAQAAPAQPLPSAKQDAQAIAGLYESSRRVQHGFLSVFYLLQQTSIADKGDGTIAGPGAPGEDSATFEEVGPQIWRVVHGTREIALRIIGGVKTVIDSEDPISVLQAVPFQRSETLNLPVLLFSAGVIFWTLILWPLAWLIRRGDRAELGIGPEIRRARLWLRGAALADAVYLGAWAMLMLPILSLQVQFYSFRIDGLVLTMELAGIVPLIAAGVGLWTTWRLFGLRTPRLSLLWSTLVAAALVGIVWISVMGGLQGVNLNY
jgi:CubicO group peptidase (beta-lactamase class C family)